ncbi:hypothetical protein QQ054_04895 [Oscillatoria amoena NRMC-F 0135]|nr:hypothetical protein [Oscillatoria amoena NRMC-F 0135]
MNFSLTLPKKKLKDHPIDKEIDPQMVMEELKKRGNCRKRFPDGRQYDYELWTYRMTAEDSSAMVRIIIPDELIKEEWEMLVTDTLGQIFMIPEHVLKKAVVLLVPDDEMLLNAKWYLDTLYPLNSFTPRQKMDQCSPQKLSEFYSQTEIRAYLETKDELLLDHPRSIQVNEPQIAKKLRSLAESFNPNETGAALKIHESLDSLGLDLSDIQKRDFLRFGWRVYESKNTRKVH